MAAFLPGLLDMVDEIYVNLDTQSKMGEGAEIPFNFMQPNQGGFPFMFMQPNANQGGCSRRPFSCPRQGGSCRRGQRYGCPMNSACQKSTDFQLKLDVKQFKPEDISVKTKDRNIIVEAKHEERAEDNGFATRHITRRYELPAEFDPNTVTSYLNNEGLLVIKASQPQPTTSSERVIEVERVESQNSEEAKDMEWEKVPVEKADETKKSEETNK